MSDSTRILTYNVQCRSWGMEALADTSFIDPTTTAEIRPGQSRTTSSPAPTTTTSSASTRCSTRTPATSSSPVCAADTRTR